MIGIDTNILLRYILQDDLPQAAKAGRVIRQAMEAGRLVFISRMVLCETLWTLARAYRLPKTQIIAVLETLLDAQGLRVDAENAMRESLELYRLRKLDFIDILIAIENRNAGASPTLTFDKKASAIPDFRLI